MIFFDCCRHRQSYLDYNYFLHQSSAFYAQFLNSGSRRKRLNRFERFISVDGDNTFHITNFTTLDAALSSYQTILPYGLHSEVRFCVWTGNSNQSQFLHQRDLELWDSRDLPNFPPLYSINCQDSCFFLFLLQSFHPFHL